MKNISPAAIRLSQATDSEHSRLWLRYRLHAARLQPVWCVNIAPCWFPSLHHHRVTDMRHEGGGHSSATDHSQLSTAFFFFFSFFASPLCSHVTGLLSFCVLLIHGWTLFARAAGGNHTRWSLSSLNNSLSLPNEYLWHIKKYTNSFSASLFSLQC